MKISTTAILAILSASSVSANVAKLTTENYSELTDGKTTFIKFFAPWCGHCQAMAEDWEKLGAEWADSDIGLVAEVDCTDPDAEGLCETIEGFPTLRYGDAEDLEDYEGGRSFDELSAFAKDTLSSKVCSVKNFDECSDEKKAEIKKIQAMAPEELLGKIKEEEDKIAASEDHIEEEVMKLQERYEELMMEHQKIIQAVKAGGLKMMKAVAKSQESTEGKDEL